MFNAQISVFLLSELHLLFKFFNPQFFSVSLLDGFVALARDLSSFFLRFQFLLFNVATLSLDLGLLAVEVFLGFGSLLEFSFSFLQHGFASLLIFYLLV
jgi:hypothetical protein